jgi:hypothetical protein
VRLLFKGNVGCVVIFCVYMCFFWNWNLPSLSLSGCLASHTLGFFSRSREGCGIFVSFARDISTNWASSQFVRLYR